MKKLATIGLYLALVSGTMAQTSDSLIIMKRQPSSWYTGHLMSASKIFVPRDSFVFPGFPKQFHTYNSLLEELYTGVGSTLLRIDARTGQLIDTFATGVPVQILESEPGKTSLLALQNFQDGVRVFRIDIHSKTITLLNTISELNTVHGSSCIDPLRRLMYVKYSDGIACIDMAGNLVDTIFPPKNLVALEFHPGTGLIYGICTDGNTRIFCSLDPVTKTFTEISVISQISQIRTTATMDVEGSRYIFHTDLGVTFIDLQTGSIRDTISESFYIIHEYINKKTEPAHILKSPESPAITAYPNPSNNIIRIQGIESGSTYEVWSDAGQLVQTGTLVETGIEINTLAPGLYSVGFANGLSVKFVRQD